MPAFSPAPQPRQSVHDFIGQVLIKASPILTWRPAKVQRVTVGGAPARKTEERSEASFNPVTFSGATTRRMVSWPVMPQLHRARGPALRALGTLVAFSLLCGSALTLCVYLLLGESSVGHAAAASSRVAVTHVTGSTLDTLSAPPAPVLAAAPPPVVAAPARTAVRAHAGHGHALPHARHHAAALHAKTARRTT